jgi:thiol-disulfide isomerase/thioredoxin
MLERAEIAIALVVIGFLVYQVLRRNHIRKTAATSIQDPILSDLKPGVPAIVYFTTPGCIPCVTQQQPALERLQTQLGDGIQVIRIDASENYEVANRWGVFSAPTTFVLDHSKQVRDVNYGVADTPKLLRQLNALQARS